MKTQAHSVAGIDVSHYQQLIDWKEVAQADYSFAFIKATEGGTVKDPLFARNWQGAKAVNIARGPYHFFRPHTKVQDQVENFVSAVGHFEVDDLPPVLDLEIPNDWKSIHLAHRVELILNWVRLVESALKRRPIMYMNPSFASDVLANSKELSSYPLWIAHYTSRPTPQIPGAWKTWNFWQHTNQGSVSGINGNVDLDWFNGDRKALAAFIASSITTG